MSIQLSDPKNDPKMLEYTMREILVWLAAEGVFRSHDIPDWGAGGTKFEAVWEALATLGDGEWLEEFGYNDGCPGNGDEWFNNFRRGEAVPTPDDDPSDWVKEEEEEEEED